MCKNAHSYKCNHQAYVFKFKVNFKHVDIFKYCVLTCWSLFKRQNTISDKFEFICNFLKVESLFNSYSRKSEYNFSVAIFEKSYLRLISNLVIKLIQIVYSVVIVVVDDSVFFSNYYTVPFLFWWFFSLDLKL